MSGVPELVAGRPAMLTGLEAYRSSWLSRIWLSLPIVARVAAAFWLVRAAEIAEATSAVRTSATIMATSNSTRL